MDDISKLLAIGECQRLVCNYANFLDSFRFEEFSALWTDDAVFTLLGSRFRGVAEIRTWLDTRDRGVICHHMVTNNVVDIINDTSAKGFCYTIVFRAPGTRGTEPGLLGPPTFLVENTTEFRKHPARGWLISRRDVVPSLAAAGSWATVPFVDKAPGA